MSEPNAKQRFMHGLFGFFLGALVAISALWWFTAAIPWWAVGASGVICAALASCFGEPFIEWLKEAWWWS